VSVRSVARAFGTTLAVIGVLLLAWGFVIWRWGDPLTGLYTRWEQRQLTREYASFVADYRPPPIRPAGTPTERARQFDVAARRLRQRLRPGQAIGRIDVDRLGLDMVLVEGTDVGSLKKGPGRDRRTYLPGEGELVYIAGHRTTFGAPFAHIDRLRRGDRVELELPYGRFVYRVSRSVVVPADDLARLRSRGTEEIALQACHPRFSARERYIVYAVPARARSGEPTSATAAQSG